MLRLRVFASVLAVLSLAVAVWVRIGEPRGGVFIALLVAAACLAIVTPFDAPDPRRRTRVVIGCLAYVMALGAAIFLARTAASGSLTIALFLLAELGLGLACWAIATRNRRRMSGVQRYYDN